MRIFMGTPIQVIGWCPENLQAIGLAIQLVDQPNTGSPLRHNKHSSQTH
jgi:hypothetical protein